MFRMFEENSEALLNEDYSEENLLNEEYADKDNKQQRKVGRWTQEEDEILKSMVLKYRGKNWKKVAEKIKGRTSIQCLHRWSKILQPGLVKGPWTIEEDRKLLDWVRREGPTKWSHCAQFISGRNGKQCRERWFNSLSPYVKKGDWTPEEDYTLFFYYKKFGGKWSHIHLFIKGRSENAIKNRFYSTLRRHSTENKKVNQDENIQTVPFKLDDLKKFLPHAEEEIKYSLMKKNNMSQEELNNFDIKLNENMMNTPIVKTNNRSIKEESNFMVSKEFSQNNESSVFNTESQKISTDQKTINNYNINVNINSNNFLSNNPSLTNLNNNPLNSVTINEENQNIFSQDFNQYKSMDIYSLEKDIAGMCDSSLFFNDNNFSNFNCFNFDTQIDHMLDNMFTQNNILITNDPEKECKICQYEEPNKDKVIDKLPNNKKEVKIENSTKSKTKKNEKNKEVFQNLLTQLNGLEKLVKNAKKELSKFEQNGEELNLSSFENILNKQN